MSTVPVEIKIAGRTYPLRVEAADEKFLRQAEKAIEKRLAQWTQNAGTRDAQDRLAMILLTGWVEMLKESNARDVKLSFLDTKLKSLAKTLQTVQPDASEA
jgi:cell division protein ZapA